ncbi:NADase-type glycan-binding domain-containing protein [Streptomyces sp. NPDC017940]|uniref:NADase-type glycan-binding domain-containing protein n=1 Tax=Streptomyces sp. NPDC017940 TaxID=3365017 RepID=UPI0037A6EB3B
MPGPDGAAGAHAAGPAPAPVTGPVPAPAAGPGTAPSGLPQRHPSGTVPEGTADRGSGHGDPAGHGGSGPYGAAGAVGDSPSALGAPDSADTARTVPTPAAPAAQYGAPAGTPVSDRARSLVVPVADPAAPTPAPAVAPVLPGRPDTDRPYVRTPGPQLGAQGAPCPWCATPNHPDRHYCGRCAMPLAERSDTAPAHRPWWRRLTAPGQQEIPWAGDRPRLRRVFDNIGTWVTVAVVMTLLILGLVYIPDGYQATRDHFAKRAPVEPDRISASRSYPDHGAKLAFDKLNNTWWGPGVAQSGQGEWIEMQFARPARLLDVIITPGVSTRADQLSKSALPHRIKATVTKKDGSTATRELTLDPGPGGQRRSFRVGEATKVRFTIESAHAASGKKQVAISEIELFGRSDGSRT